MSLLVLMTLPVTTLVAAQPAPAVAAVPDVVVQDLPPQARSTPRRVELVGLTDSGSLVYGEEAESPTPGQIGPMAAKIAPGGTSVPAAADGVAYVVGDRLVSEPATAPLRHRPVGDDAWTTMTLPDESVVLGVTGEGAVIGRPTPGSGSTSLSLLPWTGGEPVTLPGLPEGAVAEKALWSTPHGDEHVVLSLSGSSDKVVVDTVRRVVLLLRESDACPFRGPTPVINEGVLVWSARWDDGSRRLCTRSVTQDGTLGPLTTRAVPDLPGGIDPLNGYDLLPMGDVIVLAPNDSEPPRPGGGLERPLVAVDPQGDARTLAPRAHDVLDAGQGRVLSVVGDAPGHSTIATIEVSSGERTTFREIAPVGATYTSIFSDGDTLMVTDDSAPTGALRRVDFDAGSGAVGASHQLATEAAGPIAAGQGVVAWGSNRSTGSTIRRADGSELQSSLFAPVSADAGFVASATQVVSAVDGSTQRGVGALQDGVVYRLPYDPMSARPSTVLAQDLVTRQAATEPVPGCGTVKGLKVAGSWMLVRCQSSPQATPVQMLLDRTRGEIAWTVPDDQDLHLGNGFLVRRDSEGTLTWTPLDGPAPTWRHLGTAALPPSSGSSHEGRYAVSVSRGGEPTVAWYRGREAQVATLPVESSPLPPHPVGVSDPGVAVPRVEGHPTLKVSWDPRPTAEEVSRYEVRVTPASSMSTSGPRTVVASPDQTSVLVGELKEGEAYWVTLRTYNITGSTVSEPVRWVYLAPPPAAKGITVANDRLTGEATISWRLQPVSNQFEVTGFEVSLGGVEPFVVGPETRSVTVAVPRGDNFVTVRTLSSGPSPFATAGPFFFSGADLVDPRAWLSPPPEIVWSGRPATIELHASDNLELHARPHEVRWRTAPAGARLGGYAHPPEWSALPSGSFTTPTISPGTTACYSTRARDLAGRYSPWSAEGCTSAPLDDPALSRSGAGTVRSSAYYGGSATALSRKGASASYRVSANTGYLVTTVCPKCGPLDVYLGTRRLGRLTLKSAQTRHRRLVRLPGGGPLTGLLTFRSVQARTTVLIDGLVLKAR